jgi:hypothetical protein
MTGFEFVLFLAAGYVCGFSLAAPMVGSYIRVGFSIDRGTPASVLFASIAIANSLALVVGISFIFLFMVLGEGEDPQRTVYKTVIFIFGAASSATLLGYLLHLIAKKRVSMQPREDEG